MNNKKPKSGVKAAPLQNDKRIRVSAGVSLVSWTAAASGARRRFPMHRSLAEHLDAVAGLIKPNRELVSPSRFK
jgi:hypothetical protein